MLKCPNCLLTYHTEENLSNHLKRDCVGSEQFKADAKLGRMVRKLAESYKQDVALCFDNGWGWCIEIDKESNDLEYFDQPEQALTAAGIKDE